MNSVVKLSKLDHAFLNEYIQFNYMAHPVTAITMREFGLANSNQIAVRMRKHLDRISDDEAERKAEELNDWSRVEDILIAKIIGEYVSSMEDFGAICYAIKNRKKGIFKTYLKCNDKDEIEPFLDKILKIEESNISLSNLLDLPSIEELKGKLDPELFAGFQYLYKSCGEAIRKVAEQYRYIENSSNHLVKEQEDVIYIVTNIKERKTDNPSINPSSGFLKRIYNKIKHRFLVFQSVKQLEEIQKDYLIQYVVCSRKPDLIDKKLFQSCIGIPLFTAEIVALVLKLDEHGF